MNAIKGSGGSCDLGAKLQAADVTLWVGRKAFIYRSAVCRSNSIEGKAAAVRASRKRVCVCAPGLLGGLLFEELIQWCASISLNSI